MLLFRRQLVHLFQNLRQPVVRLRRLGAHLRQDLFRQVGDAAALEQRRDKTRLLKQGMMQELLTGRTRLV